MKSIGISIFGLVGALYVICYTLLFFSSPGLEYIAHHTESKMHLVCLSSDNDAWVDRIVLASNLLSKNGVFYVVENDLSTAAYIGNCKAEPVDANIK